MVQAYVIYVEEKKKGGLRKRIDLFEKIEKRLDERKAAAASKLTIEQKSESDLRTVEKSEGRDK
jgi:hypothetical protein